MNFPLTASDIGLWLAVTAIILLITSEFISTNMKYVSSITIERDRLRLVAIGSGLAFMVTVILRVIQLP